MGLLAPFMLFGLLLASAPIIIHLLNRRRFIRVDWAPMEYLRLTIKSNRRRLKLEQFLLLLVRTLIVVALFLGLARFVAERDSLAGLMSARSRVSRVVVLDDSLSMGLQTGGRTIFAKAQEAAGRVIGMSGAKDSLTVFTTSRPRRPLVRQAQLEEASAVVQTVQALEPTDAGNNWRSTFEAIDEDLLGSPFPIKEVVIITDLRASGWEGDLQEITDRWDADRVKVFLIDVGAPPSGNVVLDSLEQTDPLALVGAKSHFNAVIRNDGDQPVYGPQATLVVDDEERIVNLPDLPPMTTIDAPLTLSFDKAGQHRVELTLPGDSLNGDNRRLLVANVRESFEIVLVDGEPGSTPFSGETDFLALAFSVGRAPWRVHQMTDTEWLGQPMTAPDVLVLANVATLSRERAQALEALVESGLGLMIFPGNQLDAISWNEQLFRNGQGLLPAKLGPVLDTEVKGLAPEALTESSLSVLMRLSAGALARIQPRRLLTLAPSEQESPNVRVLASWNDAEHSPALLEKTFGAGRVLLWTITADKDWSDWPTEPSYVVGMRQAAESLAGKLGSTANVAAGSPLVEPVSADAVPAQATVLNATLGSTESALIERQGLKGPEMRFEDTLAAGFYRLDWEDPVLGRRQRHFAVSPNPAESHLEALSPDRLEQLMGKVDWELIPFAGENAALGGQGAELWRSFIIGMLALVGLESIIAAWVGRPK